MPIKGGKCTEKQLAALRAGKKDFISGDERTREIQSQGTKAAVEKRTLQAQKRTFAQHLAEILSLETKEGKTRKNGIAEGLVSALEKELASKKPNGKTINALFVAVRDTLGEAPSQKIDLNANVKTIGNWRDVPKKMENEPPPGAAVECSSDCVSVPTEERATADGQDVPTTAAGTAADIKEETRTSPEISAPNDAPKKL